jgi:hypothetical protein
MTDRILTTRQVAELALVSSDTVRRAVAKRELNRIEAFRVFRFWLSEVLLWLGRDK